MLAGLGGEGGCFMWILRGGEVGGVEDGLRGKEKKGE